MSTLDDFSRIALTPDNVEDVINRIDDDQEIMQLGDDEDEPEGGWLVARLKCIACFKNWVGVYPFVNDADFMECPRCGKLAGEKRPLYEDGADMS